MCRAFHQLNFMGLYFMVARTSIRATLLVVLGMLNLLIVGMLGYGMIDSYKDYRTAQRYIESADILSPLLRAQKHLSEERIWSIASIYVPGTQKQKYKDYLRESRLVVDADIEAVFERIRGNRIKNITLSLGKVEADYKKLEEMRRHVDLYLAKENKKVSSSPKSATSAATSNDIVVGTTSLVTSIQQLRSDFSRQLPVIGTLASNQMQLSAIVGTVTEYASREYTVLAKIIAENEYPDYALQEQLALWRGRIGYGWDMMQYVAAGSVWTSRALPIIEAAENQYFETFDDIKLIFAKIPPNAAKPDYGVSVGNWIESSTKTISAIYDMNEMVMDLDAQFRKSVQKDAQFSIAISAIMFLLAISLSVYLWQMFVLRVIAPLNNMVDSLYRTAHGQTTTIPFFQHSPQEIVKLSKVLKAMQSYSARLQTERDNANEANKAKTEFLANVSHELRTPMNVVLGMIDILMRSDYNAARKRELMYSLDESAKSLLALINDLIDFSEFEGKGIKLRLENFYLKDILFDINESLIPKARSKGLSIDLSLKGLPEDCAYMGDPARIRQIITNIYANAIKFTSKGFVRMEASRIKTDADTDEIMISIIDSGIGIEQEKVPHVFDKFMQAHSATNRKYGGVGLGLSISKALTEMMGGSIAVESIITQGTTFTIRLPLKRAEVDENSDSGNVRYFLTGKAANDSTIKVLLVEDYAPNILVGTEYLERMGVAYDVAENGKQAVEKFKNEFYDAILLDIKLTDMTGYDVARAMRGHEEQAGRIHTRIIGLTAYTRERDQQNCYAAGMDDCLLKPYTAKQLCEKIRGVHAAKCGTLNE